MAEDRNNGRRRFGLKRASIITVCTTLFLAVVYGGGVYELTRTGTAGASQGRAGKPCTADEGHPFRHGHTPTCTTSSSSSTSSGGGTTSFFTSGGGTTIITSGGGGTTSFITSGGGGTSLPGTQTPSG